MVMSATGVLSYLLMKVPEELDDTDVRDVTVMVVMSEMWEF
jgi:hypothetical protein